jgi:hypothetical protein
MAVANTLAYQDMATITVVKRFTVQTPGRLLILSLSVLIQLHLAPGTNGKKVRPESDAN